MPEIANAGCVLVRTRLDGHIVDVMSAGDVLSVLRNAVATRQPVNVVSINTHWLFLNQKTQLPLRMPSPANTLHLLDGAPAVVAVAMRARVRAQRLPGSTLLIDLLHLASSAGWRLYLLGGPEALVDDALSAVRDQYPGAIVVGAASPPRSAIADESSESRTLVAAIAAAQPDVLVVGFGQPLQEEWVARHQVELDVPVITCIGGSLQFVAGHRSRAPRWLQAVGLEWIWRLMQDPSYLWRRYFRDDLPVAVSLLSKSVIRRRRPTTRALRPGGGQKGA